ncbi:MULTISPECIES: carboxylate--amine ligase [Halorussus]|uniref:carboxylate--amine ligase n=1 Tax=Halorussus TaxID=1070314 RepID=UPI00209CCAD1|nr:carboxylate--amine ligase [Halorussus vallis]USZ78133.1 carboxylate--amine ligase [Halorussus vallis]
MGRGLVSETDDESESDGERPTAGKVAVPAIDVASSTACLRSLGRRGIGTVAFSERTSPPGFSSKYCDEAVSVPDPTNDLGAYEDALLDLARRDDVATIIPLREADVYVLARNKETLADSIRTPWPSLSTLRRVQDRVELFDAAEAAGVSTPITETLDDWEFSADHTIAKPRYTVHATEYFPEFETNRVEGHSTVYLPAGDDPDREKLVAEMGHVPLIQEYVPTADEYAFIALYDRGDPVATFQHRQRRGLKYCGGPSAYRETVDIPALETAGLALLDELDWHGLAMVEFLRDPDTGEFELMEVNPRIWSSLPFTVQAGVDFPYLYWSLATDRPIEGPIEYEVGTAGHLLRGELLHLLSIEFEDYPLVERPSLAGTAFDIAASLARHPRFDYLDLSDPGPFIRDWRNALGQVRGIVS